MILIFFGAPGSGKGTQSKIIAKKLGIYHLSTGEILREAVKDKTQVGLEAKQYMDRGDLVPDEVIIRVIAEKVLKGDIKNGYILDGFPRTLAQAKSLDRMYQNASIEIDRVIYLEVQRDKLINRLSGRRVCALCGEEYHLDFKAPKEEGVCDIDQSELIQRSDDHVAEIRTRLENYKDQTEPLVKYYQDQELLVRVDAEGQIETVSKRIFEVI
ncbi:MAG: adenylate kinase [Deltaproteobacteria bacterium]|nr:adenylate kinase [Deltaproteobacteria bacterium]